MGAGISGAGTDEIVIEGVFVPHERRAEGPFGEFTGYYSKGGNVCPVFRVRAIMHRDRPIFRGTLTGKPTAEDHQLFRLIGRAGLLNFGGSPLVRRFENFLFGRGLFPYLYWMYPLVQCVRRKRRWPKLCLPPRDLMECAEEKMGDFKAGGMAGESAEVRVAGVEAA